METQEFPRHSKLNGCPPRGHNEFSSQVRQNSVRGVGPAFSCSVFRCTNVCCAGAALTAARSLRALWLPGGPALRVSNGRGPGERGAIDRGRASRDYTERRRLPGHALAWLRPGPDREQRADLPDANPTHYRLSWAVNAFNSRSPSGDALPRSEDVGGVARRETACSTCRCSRVFGSNLDRDPDWPFWTDSMWVGTPFRGSTDRARPPACSRPAGNGAVSVGRPTSSFGLFRSLRRWRCLR